ncbi:MAG: hypothetical protein CM15mP73_1580 [Hyphomicrobiales bacterium]|nr:MAG: hypothetical protein CM15mP73_1580 [Hyphomicrobiales bacterium]
MPKWSKLYVALINKGCCYGRIVNGQESKHANIGISYLGLAKNLQRQYLLREISSKYSEVKI